MISETEYVKLTLQALVTQSITKKLEQTSQVALVCFFLLNLYMVLPE